ncbi:MAG TPA: TIGR00268 family protein, partial [Terriglobia bacterium]|nr:TIGR00268 family protein [Terriglobia bacterium]
MDDLQAKELQLQEALTKNSSLIVAYSGGVDSAYLAYAAHQALGERMLAITALSASYSARDRQ